MKQLMFLLMIGVASPAFAGVRPSAVPASVATAFGHRYPGATLVHWKAEKADYAVRFKYDNVRYTAMFENDGNWRETDRKFALTYGLPAAVRKGFGNSGYEGCDIDGIKEVVTPSGHVYIIKVDDGNFYDANHHDASTRDYRLTFSPEGKLLKAEPASFRDERGL
jgi:hypothetical protein